ncbi:hypothetical protein EXIGLDRAFT_762954 [Exidia glandulosa HHB12029]|uniref:CCHC-type domain-containing protein n=1 Tax=Exidia glandulosa HHB12029 TaxID=1314781 RepID=A0A165MFE3_EXIGL|nr:hypothetical protein EXIGLDRAFT_762954 [Exidia glandulosa HHB12029]
MPKQAITTNRFEALPVEEGEPDEPVASQAAGAASSTRHTRSASTRNESSSTPMELIIQGLDQAIHIIDSDDHTTPWWATLSTQLRTVLKTAHSRAVNLSKKQTEIPECNRVPAPTPSNQDDRSPPSQKSPGASPATTRTGPDVSLPVDTVEDVVARAMPMLKEAMARDFKDLRDALLARPLEQPDDDARSRVDRCCSHHSHDHEPPILPAPQQATERDVTISLRRVGSTDALRSLSEAEVMARVESSIAQSPTMDLPRNTVLGVKILASGNLRIRTTSEEVKSALASNPGAWLPAVAEGAQLARDLFTVEVRAVPTSFNPDSASAISGVYQANHDVLPTPSSIVNIRWIRELKQDKRSSSLLLDLDSVQALQNLVHYGISIRGRQCDVVPHVPPPIQCFFCQGWGHTVNACPRKKDNKPITCARCAGPHATSACSCPASPSCSSLRSCAHIAFKCANCGARHKSFSVDCPARRRAAREVAQQPRYARLLAIYSSSSPLSGGAATSETRRSLPYSSPPRAASAWGN